MKHCPVCADPVESDGSCHPCTMRELLRPVIEAMPPAPLLEQITAVTNAIREIRISRALLDAFGHRGRAAHALGISPQRLSEALMSYPWIVKEHPVRNTGRPAAEAPPRCPTCGYVPCHACCPGPEYAMPLDE